MSFPCQTVDFPAGRIAAVKKAAAERLLPWFARNMRALPWRQEPRDPYRVWLSEVMLQQTRIVAVVPYFKRFLARFPTLPALAAATEDEVLAVWEGLGYYARARNLRRAAQACVERHGGALPDTAEALAALPGFGPYTASAVAAFAFGRAGPVVDGNVMRVFSRLFAFGGDVASPAVKQKMTELARALLLPKHAAAGSEAWMELGETLCSPQTPSCASCPVRTVCAAHAAGREAEFPVRAKKAPVPHREEVALVLRRADGKVLLLRRDARNGLLAGLWRFPSAPAEKGVGAAKAAAGCPGARAEKTPFFALSHAFTHFTLRVRAFRAGIPRGAPLPVPPGPAAWVGPAERKNYGLAKTDAAVFAAAFPPPPSAALVLVRAVEALLERDWPAVDAARAAYCARFRNAADRARSLAATLALDRALETCGAAVPRPLAIGTRPGGKPYLAGAPALGVNWSHAGDWAAAAVAGEGIAVGVDVERAGRVPDAVAERFFHPDELAQIARLSSEKEKTAARSRIFSAKEAVLKATGEGLAGGMESFAVRLDGEAAAATVGGKKWAVRFYPLRSCVLALALPAGAAFPAKAEIFRPLAR